MHVPVDIVQGLWQWYMSPCKDLTLCVLEGQTVQAPEWLAVLDGICYLGKICLLFLPL